GLVRLRLGNYGAENVRLELAPTADVGDLRGNGQEPNDQVRGAGGDTDGSTDFLEQRADGPACRLQGDRGGLDRFLGDEDVNVRLHRELLTGRALCALVRALERGVAAIDGSCRGSCRSGCRAQGGEWGERLQQLPRAPPGRPPGQLRLHRREHVRVS